jgi:hypothetical protein
MSLAHIVLAAACLLPLSPLPAHGGEAVESELEILRDTIRANKKALVAVNLTLTDDEATKFWPVYDRYQKELTGIHDRLLRVIEDYTTSFATLSDEHALELIDAYLTVEADRAALRSAYLAEISGVLPGRKVARFYQIENKMDAVLRYDLAKAIPVVEE